ncbi:MAG TPA: 16S rRNA (cytidine(1402)-2'-O)-methyltransferase [Bryobacteraceae bacterium]|nr:16S rRNA (cytidine(1402)-2'-O)-methyltransferase [Bryobacteraceae bacterium]
MSGILHIVATPLGNLEDITYRAVRILSEASRIACEDTRHTRKLLERYSIDRPLVSYHEHNEKERTAEILSWIRGGERIALVSDAGTPLISDPGYRVVEAAVQEGLRVESIPGPSAVIAALSASGLPTDSFYFGGFLPPKSTARRRTLERLGELDCVLAFYEAPHRLVESLRDVAAALPGRQVAVARELTKMHEEWSRGTAEDVADGYASRPAVKGEATVLIGKAVAVTISAASVRETFERHLASGLSRMDAMKAAARDCNVSKRDVWNEVER